MTTEQVAIQVRGLETEPFSVLGDRPAERSRCTATKVHILPVTQKNVNQVHVLDVCSFPVRYNPHHYRNLAVPGSASHGLCFMAYAAPELPVAALCARVEDDDFEYDGGKCAKKRIYLMTLAVLPAYRRRGYGKILLERLIEEAKKRTDECAHIGLHVHPSNPAAVEFYKQFGFRVAGTVEDYYPRLDPTWAHYLAFDIPQ